MVIRKYSMVAPSGNVVVPSGSRGPVYCAIIALSPGCSVIVILLGVIGMSSSLDIIVARSLWPMAFVNGDDFNIREAVDGVIFSTSTHAVSMCLIMLRLNALAKYNISSPPFHSVLSQIKVTSLLPNKTRPWWPGGELHTFFTMVRVSVILSTLTRLTSMLLAPLKTTR